MQVKVAHKRTQSLAIMKSGAKDFNNINLSMIYETEDDNTFIRTDSNQAQSKESLGINWIIWYPILYLEYYILRIWFIYQYTLDILY